MEASEGIEADRAHVQAAILGAVAWALSSLALAAQSGHLFRLGGVVIGLFTTLPAMLFSFLEPQATAGPRARLFLAGSAAMASVGLSYIGWAEPWQVAFGYLMPAGFMVAAAILAAGLGRLRLVILPPEARAAE